MAAYRSIAAKGFEGLRTRDIANEVGVNIATLHYYFPTKEDLIRGVVNHARHRFASTMPGPGSPVAQLARHLRATRLLLLNEPELSRVLGELALRAPRDPSLAEIMRETDDVWYRALHRLLERGIAEGGLAGGLEAGPAAAAIMAALKGASLPTTAVLNPDLVEQTFIQLGRWLGLPPEEE